MKKLIAAVTALLLLCLPLAEAENSLKDLKTRPAAAPETETTEPETVEQETAEPEKTTDRTLWEKDLTLTVQTPRLGEDMFIVGMSPDGGKLLVEAEGVPACLYDLETGETMALHAGAPWVAV